jgi:SAM-dependent methyltransferase
MVKGRSKFQGISNIVRFNWHFYVFAILLVWTFFLIGNYYFSNFSLAFNILTFGVIFYLLSSVLTSYYIYDLSNLYDFQFISENKNQLVLANINAGFDETSEILQSKFPNSKIEKLDFYEAEKHTEISIKRARKIYPNSKNTIQISTHSIPFQSEHFHKLFLIFAVHEIRNSEERVLFFKELKRILKDDGEIIVIEHLRNIPNFLAYSIGFFHFHSEETWIQTFKNSNLIVRSKQKINPFIVQYTLTK